MTRKEFAALAAKKVIILDGSSGVALQKRGMPKGVCPEQWAVDNPNALIDLQRQYISAGSNMLYTFTLGGNRVKLQEHGISSSVFDINKKLAEISTQAAGSLALIAGDIGPTGRFPEPFGEAGFEETVDIFKEQVKGLAAGGVDLFVIETMIDIQEARAALLAVKESCDLPVIVSMTFDNSGRTLTGTDPVSALVTLQALGADSVGVNCSTGPSEMIEVIRQMKPYARVPLIAKPNAGLPKLVNGETVFDMNAEAFCTFAKPLVEAGANLIGGCCGTSPEYIKQTAAQAAKLKPVKPFAKPYSALSSARKTVFPGLDFIPVGERINPTGKKQLQAELKEGKESEIRRFAAEQADNGAFVLDVNTGMPGIDEKEVMVKTVKLLSTITDLPLCIDSSTPEVIEAALRIYPGKALINSISGESKKQPQLIALAAKYGAMFVLLPLNDAGIPKTVNDRVNTVKAVIKSAAKAGIGRENIAVDGLVMTVSSEPDAALKTISLIKKCRHSLKTNTIVGLSNVSFGLPERQVINSAFFNLCKDAGLTMAIANPSMDLSLKDPDAVKLLLGKDKNAAGYIGKYGAQVPNPKARGESKEPAAEMIFDCVVKGDRENIIKHVDAALKAGENPSDIVDKRLIPAINQVGELFDKKRYFLPQLIQSAEAMKAAFSILEPLLIKQNTAKEEAAVVLATVKGDIHDIGKNIVALMLKNYGFKVHDLGKDVDAHSIIRKAKETNAVIIGLSALMTTTMVEMRAVIELAKAEGLKCRFMVGGAVVTQAYADEIGADGYARDAYEAVKIAGALKNEK